MRDKNDRVALLLISRKWYNVFSSTLTLVILAFVFFDPFLKWKAFQDILDSKWLYHGLVLMTLIISYIFINSMSRNSENNYKEGQKAERKELRNWVEQNHGTSLSRKDILRKLEEEDDNS